MADQTQHTPGPWTVEEYGDEEAPTLVIHKDSETRICFMATPGSQGDPARIEADARLIAEAGTVAAEAGLTPRQLADQRAELLAALERILAEVDREDLERDGISFDLEREANKARAAIAKARGAQ